MYLIDFLIRNSLTDKKNLGKNLNSMLINCQKSVVINYSRFRSDRPHTFNIFFINYLYILYETSKGLGLFYRGLKSYFNSHAKHSHGRE